MKYSKTINIITLLLMIALSSCAQQKDSYDVISYTLPAGWKKEIKENGIQVFTGDNKTGEYAMALMIKPVESTIAANENFNTYWTKMVKGTVTVAEEPAMLPSANNNGWEIVSGWAYFTDGTNKGVVTQKTATGYGKTVTIIVMTNAEKYQKTLGELFNSISFAAQTGNASQNKTSANNSSAPIISNNSLAGKIWEGYTQEKFTTGTLNGYNTGGFFTGQYRFSADGSYRFVFISASTQLDTKQLSYETGTYSINGDKITITPKNGDNEEWSKTEKTKLSYSDVQNKKINEAWGKKLKTTARKLETVTYTYRIEFLKGNNANAFILQSNQQTEREGKGNATYYFETNPDKSAKLPAGL